MAAFMYTARDAQGVLKSATLEATNREEAISQLKKQRLNVIKIDEQTKKKKGGKVGMRDIVIFTRQFSTMINSGLPLVQAMGILAEQSENPNLRDITKQVVFDVESGNTVADALRKHPTAFSELYVNMVAAGEAGGILDTILMRLADADQDQAVLAQVRADLVLARRVELALLNLAAGCPGGVFEHRHG